MDSYQSLSEGHKKMIPNYLENLTIIQNCVDHNYEIIKLVIKDAEYMFENKTHEIENVSLIMKCRDDFFSYLTQLISAIFL